MAPESTAWQGRVETLVVDNPQSGPRKRVFLNTGSESLELDLGANASLPAGQSIKVTGRTVGKRLVVSSVSAQHDTVAAGACSAIGEQKVAVILVSFPSKALLSSVTPELMRNSFFGTGQTLDAFLRESSFGQTWATGDVLGPFVLDADYFDQPLAIRDAALRAASPSADLTKYSRFFIVAPQGQTGMESGGMALIGCGQMQSPQGTLYASSIWLGAESMNGQSEVVDTAAHEIGHGFGLEHARAADYGVEPLGPVGQAPAPWDALHDYGDNFSTMGRPPGQWAAPHKAQLGWLQAGQNIQTVTTPGNYSLSPYEQSGTGQVLRISRDGANAWLWLEYRQPLGTFDATLPASVFAGVLVHDEDPTLAPTQPGVDASTYTNLVTFHPGTAFPGDPTLHPGETWNDPYGNLSLTVTSATPAAVTVTVAYASAPTCPASVSGLQSFDASGGTGQIAVTAPGTCTWTATPSVSWISVASSSSQTGNGSLSFTVAPNGNVSSRWGKITIGGAFVIVEQAGGSGGLTISPQNSSVPASGGTGQILVATSAPDYSWAFQGNVEWITDIECSCYLSTGPATLRYVVAINPGPQRTGTISVGNLTFTVTQQGGATSPSSLTFVPLAPTDAPSARLDMAMAPFGTSGAAILFGGGWDSTVSSETWQWDGSNWTLLHPANDPGQLVSHAMAFDEARGQIVLFGGIHGSDHTFSSETWVWDGMNWHQMHPAAAPPARFAHAMAYDAARRQIILFGGFSYFGGDSNDTWAWDGANWTQIVTPDSPSPREGHALAFDPIRGEMVLFGGSHTGTSPTWFSDTWVLDAAGWHQKFSPAPPAARSGHVLAYHPGLHSVVMIGGYGGKQVGSDGTWYYDMRRETWVWNGASWMQQFPDNQPGPAYTLAAAYDSTRQALIVHVGDDLTCDSRGPKTYFLTGSAPAPSDSRSNPALPNTPRPRR